MELTLTPEERDLLLNMLEQQHQKLLKEIWHTHHRAYKATLRENEKLLESLLARLREAPVHETVA